MALSGCCATGAALLLNDAQLESPKKSLFIIFLLVKGHTKVSLSRMHTNKPGEALAAFVRRVFSSSRQADAPQHAVSQQDPSDESGHDHNNAMEAWLCRQRRRDQVRALTAQSAPADHRQLIQHILEQLPEPDVSLRDPFDSSTRASVQQSSHFAQADATFNEVAGAATSAVSPEYTRPERTRPALRRKPSYDNLARAQMYFWSVDAHGESPQASRSPSLHDKSSVPHALDLALYEAQAAECDLIDIDLRIAEQSHVRRCKAATGSECQQHKLFVETDALATVLSRREVETTDPLIQEFRASMAQERKVYRAHASESALICPLVSSTDSPSNRKMADRAKPPTAWTNKARSRAASRQIKAYEAVLDEWSRVCDRVFEKRAAVEALLGQMSAGREIHPSETLFLSPKIDASAESEDQILGRGVTGHRWNSHGPPTSLPLATDLPAATASAPRRQSRDSSISTLGGVVLPYHLARDPRYHNAQDESPIGAPAYDMPKLTRTVRRVKGSHCLSNGYAADVSSASLDSASSEGSVDTLSNEVLDLKSSDSANSCADRFKTSIRSGSEKVSSDIRNAQSPANDLSTTTVQRPNLRLEIPVDADSARESRKNGSSYSSSTGNAPLARPRSGPRIAIETSTPSSRATASSCGSGPDKGHCGVSLHQASDSSGHRLNECRTETPASPHHTLPPKITRPGSPYPGTRIKPSLPPLESLPPLPTLQMQRLKEARNSQTSLATTARFTVASGPSMPSLPPLSVISSVAAAGDSTESIPVVTELDLEIARQQRQTRRRRRQHHGQHRFTELSTASDEFLSQALDEE